jgi:phosphatidylinositol alpha-1,6-mannosyltransferase
MRIVALLTDAYGGFGGIAMYNRDLLEAMCGHGRVEQVQAFPRKITHPVEPMPARLDYRREASGGVVAFARAVSLEMLWGPRPDLIYCAHINLAPVAMAMRIRWRAPVLLGLYGVECWQPTGRRIADRAARSFDQFYAISRITRSRFSSWSGVSEDRIHLLPNAIHLESYGVAPASEDVCRRFGLIGRTVILTLGRIVSEERAKGFDEVIGALSELRTRIPNILYVIAGDGSYRSALEDKVRGLGLEKQVVFTGKVSEADKVELYRAAHAYVMPSRGEGFGFVFLEAMACGTPCVASSADGSSDAVRDGTLGSMIDPGDQNALVAATVAAVAKKKEVPAGLEYFGFPSFRRRVHNMLDTSGY